MGGLLVPFGDVPLGQRPAQPSVLVVHVLPLLSASPHPRVLLDRQRQNDRPLG
jgi:hypothetical protein